MNEMNKSSIEKQHDNVLMPVKANGTQTGHHEFDLADTDARFGVKSDKSKFAFSPRRSGI